MQAGSVTLGTTTASIFGPLAAASHVTLVPAGGTSFLVGASAGLTYADDQPDLCSMPGNAATPLRMGEGESLFACVSSGSGTLGYLVFPE